MQKKTHYGESTQYAATIESHRLSDATCAGEWRDKAIPMMENMNINIVTIDRRMMSNGKNSYLRVVYVFFTSFLRLFYVFFTCFLRKSYYQKCRYDDSEYSKRAEGYRTQRT